MIRVSTHVSETLMISTLCLIVSQLENEDWQECIRDMMMVVLLSDFLVAALMRMI